MFPSLEEIIPKLNHILWFSLLAFFLAMVFYPPYIRLLQRRKMGKTIREHDATGKDATNFKLLHAHKAGTPNLGWGLFLLIMIVMIVVSLILQKRGYVTHSLRNQKETYIILFWFFSMGILWLVDDIINLKWIGKVKWLSAKAKLVTMVFFAWFIAYWFYGVLGVDYFNIWPLHHLWGGESLIHVGFLFPVIAFVLTIGIVNAINITDGLDWLAGGLMTIILFTMALLTLLNTTYIATTVIAIVIATLSAFLWYNINPAKIFMGDSGAFALGWLLSSLLFLLNMRQWIGIIIPFIILFLLFILEVWSSFLQILRKKFYKKKLFVLAPFHHALEHQGMKETTIVMKFWLVQTVLAAITLIAILYQFHQSL